MFGFTFAATICFSLLYLLGLLCQNTFDFDLTENDDASSLFVLGFAIYDLFVTSQSLYGIYITRLYNTFMHKRCC